MSSSGEEEETGPSVDSADPEERIAARRLRIQRRLEAQKRLKKKNHQKYMAFRASLREVFSRSLPGIFKPVYKMLKVN